MNKLRSTFKSFATKTIGLSGAVTAACMTLAVQPAQALDLSFTTTDFDITNGIGDTNASPNITLDNGTVNPPDGFGDVFSSSFILLGANTSDSNISSDSLRNSNSQVRLNTASSFELTQEDVDLGVRLTFNWAFQGNSSGNPGDADSFLIQLFGGPSPTQTFILQQAPNYGSQIGATADIAPGVLTAGTGYRIAITVNENDDLDGNSSAGGFNQIQLKTIPFGFSTNASLVVFGGAFYGLNRMRKKMAAKKLEL